VLRDLEPAIVEEGLHAFLRAAAERQAISAG
jgi:hypothetical protein